MTRKELIQQLIQNFLNDLMTCAQPFDKVEERADFLESLLEYLKGVYSYQAPVPEYNFEGYDFDSNGFIRKNILYRFKDKAKPFLETNLRLYFEKDSGFMTALFKKLKIEEPLLTEEEYEHYTTILNTLLNNLIAKVLTQGIDIPKKETDLKTLSEADGNSIQGFKSTSKEYTRTRQVLLYYFILQLLGKGRADNSMRKNAQFAHVLFAWPIDNIDNSAIYRMLKKAPALREKDGLLKDLEYIKSQFILIDSLEGVSLVQKEINYIKGS